MNYVYILALEDDNYYAGKTSGLERRLEEHFSGGGSEWTKLHKPTGKIHLIRNTDDYEEDRQTLVMMRAHGIDRVRGGAFSQIKRTEMEVKMIERMLNSSTDACFVCGEKDHFVKDCPTKKTDNSSLKKEKEEPVKQTFLCTCCGRFWDQPGRFEKFQCHFCTDLGLAMYEEEFLVCALCGRDSHRREKCYAKKDTQGKAIAPYQTLPKYEKETGCCAKCGRTGHTYKSCYAKTDAQGYKLKF